MPKSIFPKSKSKSKRPRDLNTWDLRIMLYNSILRQTPPYTVSVFRARQAIQQLVVPGLFASPFSGFLPFSCHTWFCHYSATLPLCLCSLSASAVRCLPNITLSFTLIFFSLSFLFFLFVVRPPGQHTAASSSVLSATNLKL